MTTGAWVTLVILTNLVSLLAGAVLWHRMGAADREQDWSSRYNDGFSTGQKAGFLAGLKEQSELQKAKDSARATKAARTRQANKEGK